MTKYLSSLTTLLALLIVSGFSQNNQNAYQHSTRTKNEVLESLSHVGVDVGVTKRNLLKLFEFEKESNNLYMKDGCWVTLSNGICSDVTYDSHYGYHNGGNTIMPAVGTPIKLTT